MRRGPLKLISGELATMQHTSAAPRYVPSNSASLCSFSIFDDVGDYILSSSSSSKPPKEKDRHRERDRDREDDSKSRRHTYFEKPRVDEHQVCVVFNVFMVQTS